MDIKSNYKYLLSDLSILKGVGIKTSKLLKKKKLIIFLIYYGDYQNHYTDRSLSSKIKDLKIR